jgi:hypothetical protein
MGLRIGSGTLDSLDQDKGMNVSDVLVLIAAIAFGVDAVIHRSIIAGGLCLFALSFVIRELISALI